MGDRRHRIRVAPDNRTIEADRGEPLLAALAAGGILLRADCGGMGRCGKCRVCARWEGDDAGTSVLACAARVDGDLWVEIPEGSRLTPEVMQKDRLVSAGAAGIPVIADPVDPAHDLGLAVDLGTTTIALYLCDLTAGGLVSSASLKNPQAIYGADVMSRITAIREGPDLLKRLQGLAVDAIKRGASALCRPAGMGLERIRKAVIVGNSAMIHIVTGHDPASLGVAPYRPVFTEALRRTVGRATVWTLPLVAGFIGSDAVAAAMAADLANKPPGTLLADVGTNGEVLIRSATGIIAASCATGPAFEGATIAHGMPAVRGAIDGVAITNGRVRYSVIGGEDAPPAGICGSGALSAAAELLRAGIVDPGGRFRTGPDRHPRVDRDDAGWGFTLAPAGETEGGAPVRFTQLDVRAVQLAKGALRTGIDILREESGIEEVAEILLAGAFGSFMGKADVLRIGMFPPLPEERITAAGNAAGIGAVMALLDDGVRERASDLAAAVRVVDLAAHPTFQDRFIDALGFPPERPGAP